MFEKNKCSVQVEGVAGEFGKRLLAGCDSERRAAVQGAAWRVEQRVRTDDFSAETTNIDDFTPNGYFCVYQDQESFEYIRGCAEKTLLSSLEQEDKLPFQHHNCSSTSAAETVQRVSTLYPLAKDE
ncbi:hypothetical protein MSG28_011532 [Choristoneura fumiferana]|uniref:Uncharacterized protein n=1 Tax=Choristoneura fumiferana TaxID=7141 RepID=A0ACC0JNR1_CHOFU|nr:hypothetical protein MSG28_011532 [Choristoneura fumiferana]